MGRYYPYARRAYRHYRSYKPIYDATGKYVASALQQRIAASSKRKRKATADVIAKATKRVRAKKDRAFSKEVLQQRQKGAWPKLCKQPGAGLSFTASKLSYPAQKGWKAAVKQSYRDVQIYNTSGIIRSSLGAQGVACIQGTQTTPTIDGTERRGFLYPSQALALYSQSLNTTAAYDATFAANTAARNFKYYCDGVSTTTLLTNQSPSTIVLTLYDVVARDDVSDNPVLDWSAGITYEQGVFPGSTTPTVWGAKPTDILFFNKRWKIIKSHKIEMPTGRCHQHKFNFNYKGSIPMVDENFTGTPTVNAHKGITCNTLAIVHGVPIDDKNQHGPSGDPDTTLVSLDQVKLSFVTCTKFFMRFNSAKPKKYYSSSGLPSTGASWFVQSENTQEVLNTITATNTA